MADTSARDKLRSTGGIMASSEELMRAVEERLSGRTFAPGYDLQTPTMRSAVREEGLDYPSFELLRRTTPSRRTLQALGYPESSLGGSMYFDRLAAGMGLADSDKKMPPYNTSLGAQFRTQPLERPRPTDEQRAAGFLDPAAATAVARASELNPESTIRRNAINTILELEEKQGLVALGPAEQEELDKAKKLLSQIKNSESLLTEGIYDEDIVMGQEVISDERRAELETARQNAPRFDPLIGAKKAADAAIDKKMNADAAAPKELVRRIVDATERQINDPEPKAKKDLRSRYSENIALFKEIYGIDDGDRARDKMMSLAMIGLAIAAGQSPNALTNFAQGALTGLKAWSESAAERRQQDRDLRTAALEAALSSEAAATEAEARAAEKEYDRETELRVQLLKNAGKDTEVAEKFLKMTPPGRAFLEQRQRIEDSINTSEGVHYNATKDLEDPAALRMYIDKAAFDAISPAFSPTELEEIRLPLQIAAAPQKADPALQKQIEQYRKQNIPDDQIRKGLVVRQIDPALYGL